MNRREALSRRLETLSNHPDRASRRLETLSNPRNTLSRPWERVSFSLESLSNRREDLIQSLNAGLPRLREALLPREEGRQEPRGAFRYRVLCRPALGDSTVIRPSATSASIAR